MIPDKGKTLLVCMVGATSLRVAELLGTKGIDALSITGGIMGLSQIGKAPAEIVQMATE